MGFRELYHIAWRNLLRNRRRTLITAFSVAFGVLLSVTFTASGDYSYTNLINTSATLGFGHLTVEAKGYNDTPSLTMPLTGSGAIRELVADIPGVSSALVRIVGQAMFASGAKSVGGQVIGFDPGREDGAYNIYLRSLQTGAAPGADDPGGVLIGARMAEKLNLGVGKKLIYTMTDRNGELVSGISRVRGIFATGENQVDGAVVLLPLTRLRQVLKYSPDEATLVSIFISDQRRAARMQDELAQILAEPEREILTWRETQAELAGLIAIDRAGNYLMQFLVGLLVAAGIFNTMLMSVMERRREFGMMMALGMGPRQVVAQVLLESLLIGGLGLVLGVIITAPWYLYMVRVGIDFSGQIGNDYSTSGVLVDPVLKFRLFQESALAILAGIMLLTLVAGVIPAIRAGRVAPLESLRGK
ncbi:MAG: ABC transporter permease [Desulfobulbaceae bacterium]|nr:ABC transporter permease [Desulfobulbaceae bacterium]